VRRRNTRSTYRYEPNITSPQMTMAAMGTER